MQRRYNLKISVKLISGFLLVALIRSRYLKQLWPR
jgi:hypothetical protein